MALRSALICHSPLSRAVVTIFSIAMGVAASAETTPTFGPNTYVRDTGDVVIITEEFTVLNPNDPFSLRVINRGIQKWKDRDARARKDQEGT
jgi:hypothetical protein